MKVCVTENSLGYKFFSLDNAFENIIMQFDKMEKSGKFDYTGKIREYERALKKKAVDRIYLDDKKETYDFVFELCDENDWYTLTWDVAKLREIISRNSIISELIDINHLYSLIDTSVIDKPIRIETSPAIMLDILPLNEEIIVDGNKRIVHAYDNGKKLYPVCKIPSELHLEAMNCDYMRMLYKMHYNINLLVLFVSGVILYAEFLSREFEL